ncbi:MAG: hypothetical protein JHD07_24460 [Bradyrhizobium sp.]|uniref:hypothetical protein n=1 Tax=Bradyrhizobium sp. TaxID=376 RepID=UPI001A1F1E05|nr:hypothetical protein [Bradyrhizobium sp.]MBJ7406279.1 hypothetical protein [Bradyrhizobium sp.]
MMPMRIRRKSQSIEKLETLPHCNDAENHFRATMQIRSRVRQCGAASSCPGLSGASTFFVLRGQTWMAGPSPAMTGEEPHSKHAKLLRGQALPDMRGLAGKVAENCGKSRLEPAQIRKLLRIRPKFLAAQRRTF